MKALNLEPGRPAKDAGGRYLLPTGDRAKIVVEWDAGGKKRTAPVESFVIDTKTGKPMKQVAWPFTGSQWGKDPETGKRTLKVNMVGNLVSLHHLDPTVLFQNPLGAGRDDNRYKANMKALPREGTKVTLVIIPVKGKEKMTREEGVERIHWLVHGWVQGVGFRFYTERNARRLGIKGWVRNLPNGQVEIVAEGPRGAMKSFKEAIRQGPRGSRVEKVVEADVDISELLDRFRILPTPLR